jgi:hypothetical protein
MSRELPPRPSLEHLKKQAKDRLEVLLQSDPKAQLADAQHDVARDYGFASWPKLKAHVEWMTNDTPPREHPFAGSWTANVARSKQHPANPIRRATIQISVQGEKVVLDDVVVDEAGREERHRNTLYTDGQEHPSDYGNGYVILAAWRGSRVLEVASRQNAADAGRVVYEVSADGRTLTVTGPTGEQVGLFERQ